jgi:phage/plasmid-associated DNA primase
LFKLLVKIFQKAIDTISTDVIIERTNKSSITTEFEKLDKSRLGYITELKEVHKLNIDIIKKISGGDDMDSRGLFKSNNTIQPTTNLCVLTNELPKFHTEQAIIDRIIIIPFNNRFDVNINYEEEMMNKKDLIFSFIMKKGNIKDKFDLTEEMISSKNEYIENNTKDYLKDFIEEYYDIKEFIKKEKILRDEFRRCYDEYCIKKRIKINNDTNTKFTRELLKKYNIDSKETNGKSYYIGLVKKADIIEEEEEN